MPANEKLKVIIVGGGVAGLTLANMLEKFDVDYVLLEAYHDIAPQVGASIGMFPNGLRILDQLGCYEAIKKLSWGQLILANTCNSEGKPISTIKDMVAHLEKRHGYPMLFFDRQWLLQVLYDHLKHKERVHLNKKVAKLDHIGAAGIQVTTEDGDIFNGTLVIGADGIHSTVREEMFRIGNELQPGYFPPDESEHVPCHYKCSFGIAQNVLGWVPGDHNMVHGRGHSQFLISGPENRVYWFLFIRLPEVKYGRDIPQYTKEDEAQLVEEYFNLPVNGKVTFGEIYAKRLSSALTPLHEIVYKKWFFKRIMIFGDSAHKPNPIGGQGGNGAIESAAEFTNALIAKRARPTGLSGLSDQDIEDIFAQTQMARQKRAEEVVRSSHTAQAQNAWESVIVSTLLWKVVLPLAGDETVLGIAAMSYLDAARLKDLPVPYRSRAIPYTDELPAKPVGQTVSKFARLSFAGGMGCLLWAATTTWLLPLPESGSPSSLSGMLRDTGSTFSYPVLGKERSLVYAIYLLSQHMSPLLIYTIEGYRLGNRPTMLSLPSAFIVGMQLIGFGKIAPLYALTSAFQGHSSPTGRFVRPEVAKAILPAFALAVAGPAVLMAMSIWNTDIWKNWGLLWKAAPVVFSVSTLVISRQQKPEKEGDEAAYDRYSTHDVSILKSVYKFAIAAQATVHIATLVYSCLYQNPPISHMLGLTGILTSNGGFSTMASELIAAVGRDALVASVACVASNLYSVWDLRRLGYIKTYDAVKAALGVLCGQVFIGPGATWAGLWYWREGVLVGLRS